MNRRFKLVFNRSRGKMMAVNEITRAVGKATASAALLTVAAAALAGPAPAFSLPASGVFDQDLIVEPQAVGSSRVGMGLLLEKDETRRYEMTDGATLRVQLPADAENPGQIIFGVRAIESSSLDIHGATDITLNGPTISGMVGFETLSDGSVATDDLTINLKARTVTDGLRVRAIPKTTENQNDTPLHIRGDLSIDLAADQVRGIRVIPPQPEKPDDPIGTFLPAVFEGNTAIRAQGHRTMVGIENFGNLRFEKDLSIDLTFVPKESTAAQPMLEQSRHTGIQSAGDLSVAGDLSINIKAQDDQEFDKDPIGIEMLAGRFAVDGKTDISIELKGGWVQGIAGENFLPVSLSKEMSFGDDTAIRLTGDFAEGIILSNAPGILDSFADSEKLPETDNPVHKIHFGKNLTVDSEGAYEARGVAVNNWDFGVDGNLSIRAKAGEDATGLAVDNLSFSGLNTSTSIGGDLTVTAEAGSATGFSLMNGAGDFKVQGRTVIEAKGEELGVGLLTGYGFFALNEEARIQKPTDFGTIHFGNGASISASGQYTSALALSDPLTIVGDMAIKADGIQWASGIILDETHWVERGAAPADPKVAKFDGSVSIDVTGKFNALGFRQQADTVVTGNLSMNTEKTSGKLNPETPVVGIESRNRLSVGGDLTINTSDATRYGEEHYEVRTVVTGIESEADLHVAGNTAIRTTGLSSDAFGLHFDGSSRKPVAVRFDGDLSIDSLSDRSAYGVILSSSTFDVLGNTSIDTTSKTGKETLSMVAVDSRVNFRGKENRFKGDLDFINSSLTFGSTAGGYSHTVIDGSLTGISLFSYAETPDTKAATNLQQLTLSHGALDVKGNTDLPGLTVMENASLSTAGTAKIDRLDAQKAEIKLQNADSKLTVNKIDRPGEVTIAGSADLNDSTGGDLTVLLNNLTLGDGVKTADLGGFKMDAGEVLGTVTGRVEADGSMTKKVEANPKNLAKLHLTATLSQSAARIEANEMRKRLGEVRNAKDVNGVWARVNGGSLSGLNGFESDFSMVQVGTDRALGEGLPRIGAAFSYTDSDADDPLGSAESETWTLAGYGVWTWENGLYTDLIGRVGKIDTDLKQSGETAGIDGLLWSVSGEIGAKANLGSLFFVEPSAEVTWTRLEGDSFTMGGIQRDIKDTDSVTGRFGATIGMNLPQNLGEAYLRAGLVHEFSGDATITSDNGVIRATETWSGQDTWVEYAVGANLTVNGNTVIYADLERTEGAELEEDWRANIGLRVNF